MMKSTRHLVRASVLAVVIGIGCGGKVLATEICGSGTRDVLGSCVPDLTGSETCGPGTHFYNGKCLLDSSAGLEDAGASDARSVPVPDVNTACLIKDNIFVIAGDDFIHTGPAYVIQGGVGWEP
ncbi:MAG: hypothetical protein ABIP89_01110, partial [Polyangiaceae bacterium]